MKELTNQEVQLGRHFWQVEYERNLGRDMEFCQLKKARHCLLMSVETLATKLEISKAAYSKFEERELAGTISLQTLRKAAEAMDCELVYEIRPKKSKSFADVIWEKIFKVASKSGRLKTCDQKKRGNALAAISKDLMKDPKFRKSQGWRNNREATQQ